MARVPLMANERFYYDGRNVEKDEQFDCEERDVALLTHSVSPRARLPDVLEPHRATRKETADEPAPKPARYRRRDLEAEDS
jgi:hypothetical protein